MTRRPRPFLAAALAVASAAVLGGCSLVPGLGGPKYHVTVWFTKALSFYPQSQVQVMGANIGTVDSVTPENGLVKVTASINKDVPLPADVSAAIVPLSLIGERTLSFTPPWKPGQPKLADGAVIPAQRTQVPVEVDQALQAFTSLIQAFNPADANKLLANGAKSLKGNGAAFNAALQQTADLSANIAGQDDQLLDIAKNLHDVAGVVTQRQGQLGQLISDFTDASKVLADERQQIQTFLTALAGLVKRGDVLIKSYEGNLTGDLGKFAQISLVVKNDATQLATFLQSLKPLNYMLVNATNHQHHSLVLRLALDNVWRSYLAAALKQPNVNPSVPCWPQPYSNCQ